MSINRLMIQFSKQLYISKSKNILTAYSNCIIPARDKHGLRKIRGVFDNYWVPRKRKFTDDKLTVENKAFLQEVIADTFLKPGESPLKENVNESRAKWTPDSVRAGLIARKIGIYPMWTKDGQRIMTTLLQIVDNHVIRYNPPETFAQSKYYDNVADKTKVYGSLVVGAESADPQLFTAAYCGLFKEAGVMPKKKLTRFRITPDAVIEPGTPLFVNHFRVGDYVNIRGISRYHGFQGVMKRWGFKGGPATHGTTKNHRRPGCIGGGVWDGDVTSHTSNFLMLRAARMIIDSDSRHSFWLGVFIWNSPNICSFMSFWLHLRKRGVWKGKKMPGLMGGYYKLLVGVKILRINTKYNVLFVLGPAVPGVNNNYCTIYDCYVKKKIHTEENPPPFPTFYPEDLTEPLPEDIYAKDLHTFSDPTITIEEDEKD